MSEYVKHPRDQYQFQRLDWDDLVAVRHPEGHTTLMPLDEFLAGFAVGSDWIRQEGVEW